MPSARLPTRRRSRLRWWIAGVALTLLVLLGSALAVVRIQFEGPDLAQNLCEMMNSRMRGKIEIQSIEWPMSDLPKVVSGGWLPVTLRNVAIWDGEGERVVHTEKITGELDVHSLLFGRHDFVLRKVVLHGGKVVLSEISEPYPLHDYDYTVFSIIAAFYGRREAGFHAGIFAATSPLWDLRDFEIRGVDLEIRTKPIGKAFLFRAAVADVSGSGFFYMDPSDPLVPKFYVSLKLTGGEGQIDLYYERDKTGQWKPKGEYSFPVKGVEVRRMAQLPGGWPTDPVANTLGFDVVVETKNGAKASVGGAMIDYWDTPYGGIWDVTLKVENAGALLRQSVDPDVGGEAVTLEATVTGPIIFYPSVAIKATGLTYKLSMLEPPLMLELDALHAVYDLAVDEGSVDEFIARGADGRVRLSAKWGGDGSDRSPYWVDSDIGIDQAIDMSPWMPPTLLRAVGSGRLSGSFHALRRKGDTTYGISVDKIDLRVGQLRVDRGQIYLDKSLAKVHVDGVRFSMPNFLGTLKCTVLTGGEEIAFDDNDCEAEIESGNVEALINLIKSGSKARKTQGKGAKPTKAAVAPKPATPTVTAQPRRGVRVVRPLRRTGSRYHHAQPPPPQQPPTRRTTSGTTTVQIGGSVSNLNVKSQVNFKGVPILGDLRGTITFANNVVTIVNATSRSLGNLRFSGSVNVAGAPYLNPLKVVATNVDLSKIKTVKEVIAGKVSANVTLRGPLDPKRMVFDGWACSDQVVALGETLADVAVWLNQRPTSLGCHNKTPVAIARHVVDACLKVGATSNGRCAIVRATREKGGDLTAAVSADGKQQLGGEIQISHLPLAAILKLAGSTLEADALIETTGLAVGGTVDAPQLDGTLKLTKAWIMGGYLGDGDLAIKPAGPGFVSFNGSFLDGRINVSGTLGTRAPYPLELTADVTQLEADIFVDLKAMGLPPNTQIWGTGRVQVKTELGSSGPGKAPLAATVDLADLSIVGEAEGPDGQPVPLAIRALAPLQVSWDGTRARFTTPAKMSTPMGEITVEGEASPTKIDLAAKGRLDLMKAQPLFGAFFDRTTGSAEITARVTGSAKLPKFQVSLDLADVALRLAGQDSMLRIPGGRIDFSDSKLSLTGLSVEVDDGYQRSTAPLNVKGGVTFAGLKPKDWAVIIEGELAGEMLMAFAPDVFAQASGTASLNVVIRTPSPGAPPKVTGELSFGDGRSLRVLPRALRREIALDRGTVTFEGPKASDLTINIEEVGGKIDDEGTLRDIEGSIELKDWKVAAADVVASGDALTFRIQRTLDLVLSLDAIRVVLDRGQLEIAGGVELTTGRYTANFDLGETLVPSVPSGPSAPPIWETTPLLGAARLDLQVDVRKFSVVNNLANIDLYGRVAISGTPRDPRFDDTIHVERGTFRIPLVRPRFTRTSGRAEFSSRRRVLDQTPTLSITSEADYRDSSGQEHLITLSIFGDWPRLTWDLSTSSGLDKSQTLTLILSGRTPEELRRNLGDQALVSDPTRIDPSTGNSQGVTDELVRQFASDLLEARFAEPLREISNLDVARIELNLSSFGFHGEERFTETTRALGDFERTTRGSSINIRVEQRLPHQQLRRIFGWAGGELSTFAAEAGFLVKRFDDEADDDVNDLEFKGVLRLLFGK